MGYFYRGRHRAPSRAARRAAQAVAVGAMSGVGLTASSSMAAADILDNIAQCESSGNPHASGPVTEAGGHFGLYQFDLQTWQSVGGTGNPADASPAEQTARARTLLARRGTQPWDASRPCWGGMAGGAPVARRPAPRPAPRPAGVAPAAGAGRSVTVQAGDTLSGIAVAHGTTWQALWQANGATVADPDVIYPDERLMLP